MTPWTGTIPDRLKTTAGIQEFARCTPALVAVGVAAPGGAVVLAQPGGFVQHPAWRAGDALTFCGVLVAGQCGHVVGGGVGVDVEELRALGKRRVRDDLHAGDDPAAKDR